MIVKSKTAYLTRDGRIVDIIGKVTDENHPGFGLFEGVFRSGGGRTGWHENGLMKLDRTSPSDLVEEFVVTNQPIIIRTTVQRDYVFHPGAVDGRSPQELVQEFFIDYPAGSYHAARDGSHVGGADKVIEAKVITVEELGYKLGGYRP